MRSVFRATRRCFTTTTEEASPEAAPKFPIPPDKFAQYSHVDRIRAAFDVHGPRVVQLASMQKSAGVVMHLIHLSKLPIPILFIDTQYLHQETIDLRDKFQHKYGLEIRTVRPELTPTQQDLIHGKDLWKTKAGQPQCCYMRKEKPFMDAMTDMKAEATLAGLMRSEGGARKDTQAVGYDPRLNHFLYHPIFDFTNARVHAYTKEHDIPVHPLYALDYMSIGCAPCTTPVKPGEDARAGRWRHLRDEKEGKGVTYCGINYSDTKRSSHPGVVQKPLFRKRTPPSDS